MDSEAEKILTLVAERAQLAEGIEGVRSILLIMYRFPSLKNKKVAQKTEIAIPTLAAVRGELVKAGIIEKKNFLGEKGREWVKTRLNLRFDYEPDKESAAELIPEQFSVPDSPIAVVTFAEYPWSTVSPYREAILALGVSYKGESIQYMIQLILNSNMPIIGGREVYGYP